MLLFLRLINGFVKLLGSIMTEVICNDAGIPVSCKRASLTVRLFLSVFRSGAKYLLIGLFKSIRPLS